MQRRTKKEIMEEVIAKSKYFKASLFGFCVLLVAVCNIFDGLLYSHPFCRRRYQCRINIMHSSVRINKIKKSRLLLQAQKAKEKEEDQELKEKLDADFAAIAQSRGLLALVRPKKVDALKSLLAKGPTDIGSAMKVLKAGDKSEEVKVISFTEHYFPIGHLFVQVC